MTSSPVSPATQAKFARSVLKDHLHVKSGERVIVEAWTHTLPWAVAIAREARQMGAQVLVPYEDEEAYLGLGSGRARTSPGKASRPRMGSSRKHKRIHPHVGPGGSHAAQRPSGGST